jgi:hypothetical protein
VLSLGPEIAEFVRGLEPKQAFDLMGTAMPGAGKKKTRRTKK